MHNVTIELAAAVDTMSGDARGDLIDQFTDFHPVIARSSLGRADLILSLPAESVWDAASLVRAAVDGTPVSRVIIESSVDFDMRSDAVS